MLYQQYSAWLRIAQLVSERLDIVLIKTQIFIKLRGSRGGEDQQMILLVFGRLGVPFVVDLP